MSAESASRLSHWWLHGVDPVDRVRPPIQGSSRATRFAAWATRALRSLQRGLRQGVGEREPRNADELLAYARRIEHHSPGLAADLRAAALHDPAGEP